MSINLFLWNSFPLEFKKFNTVICKSNTNNLSTLCEYIKLIYPSIPIVNKISENNENNILFLNVDETKLNWIDILQLNKLYEEKRMIIIYGSFENIPKVCYYSDVVFFSNKDDINNYLVNQRVEQFDNDSFLLVVDRRRIETGSEKEKCGLVVKCFEKTQIVC